MYSYEYIKDFIVTTDTNTNKNDSSNLYTFSSASVTVPAMNYIVRSYNIPTPTNTRLYQILVNISRDGDVYYAVPNQDRRYGTTGQQLIATVVSNSGSNISINLYLVAQTPTGSQTFPAFNVNVILNTFVDEL